MIPKGKTRPLFPPSPVALALSTLVQAAACPCGCVPTNTHTHTHTHAQHAHTRTYIHTHTHTPRNNQRMSTGRSTEIEGRREETWRTRESWTRMPMSRGVPRMCYPANTRTRTQTHTTLTHIYTYIHAHTRTYNRNNKRMSTARSTETERRREETWRTRASWTQTTISKGARRMCSPLASMWGQRLARFDERCLLKHFSLVCVCGCLGCALVWGR